MDGTNGRNKNKNIRFFEYVHLVAIKNFKYFKYLNVKLYACLN